MVGAVGSCASLPDETWDDGRKVAAAVAAAERVYARRRFAVKGADGTCLGVPGQDLDSSLCAETWPYVSGSEPSDCPWW